MTEVAELYEESFAPHTHEDDEMPHVHAVESDWALSIMVPMVASSPVDLDVVELMEFRRIVTGMMRKIESEAKRTQLETLPVHEQQFLIIAMNADMQLGRGLLDVTEGMLKDFGIYPPCQLQPVESSSIRSWGYVSEQQEDGSIPDHGTVYVAFVGGGLYRYADVPEALVDEWIGAESVGKFFAARIRKGFEFEKVV